MDRANVKPSLPSDTTASKSKIITEYKDVFQRRGRFRITYNIELKDDVTPVIYPSRRVPTTIKPKIKLALDKLETDKIIAKVEHATDWVSNLVIVEQPNGLLRLCLDPKDLNKAIKHQHFLIPTAEPKKWLERKCFLL